MQLDAFLRSAKRYAPYETITPLIRPSRDHVISYGTCWDAHNEGQPWPTDRTMAFGAFGEYVRYFLGKHERVVFHTDDDVFFAEAKEPPAVLYGDPTEDIQRIHSYRLGWNTTFCHPLSVKQRVPDSLPWRWREAELDFGYPLCLNGTVYRSADLLPLLNFPFANPTELEAGLDYRKELFRPEWMTAPLHSCCVSLPHNRVSFSSGCPAGANPEWQPDALLAKYLDGWRIDLEAMDFSNINAAHVEVPLVFAR
jgi:hypothetical protein